MIIIEVFNDNLNKVGEDAAILGPELLNEASSDGLACSIVTYQQMELYCNVDTTSYWLKCA